MCVYDTEDTNLGLRKARSQRRPLQLTSLAKPWGEFEGGDSRIALSTRPPGVQIRAKIRLKFRCGF